MLFPKVSTESLLKELGLKDYKLGKTKLFIREFRWNCIVVFVFAEILFLGTPATLFKMEDLRSKFLQDSAKLCPLTDQLIYGPSFLSLPVQQEFSSLVNS